MYRRFSLTGVVIALVVLSVPDAGVADRAVTASASGSIALFEGRQIDLAQGWGDARACVVARSGGVVECFADQAGLLAREAQLGARNVAPAAVASASCATPLRLYADTGYGGRELDFYDRGFWQNLSDWSFGNQLSSYRVGGCGVSLADGANGGGSSYPGNTSAGHAEPAMSSGWDNRVSSIFIK
jgi:hypothetical protein